MPAECLMQTSPKHYKSISKTARSNPIGKVKVKLLMDSFMEELATGFAGLQIWCQ